MWKKIIVVLIVLASCCNSLFAQARLVLIDAESGDRLPHAHVCFESIDKKDVSYVLADKQGIVENNISKPSVISVSFIGYHTLMDTIFPDQSVNLYITPSIYDVGEVVVTAQFSPKKVDNSIYKVRVIDNGMVEKKGASNLSDLISNELNFSPTRDAALGTSVRIQGLGGEHVKILIDGVPMVGRQNGILDLSQINVSNIDHIEVVEGPMSVVYGSNAMAGVINIITKENSRKSLTAGLDTYYESVGVYDFDGSFSINTGMHSFGMNVGRYFFGGFSEIDDTRTKEWDPKLQYSTEGYYTFKHKGYKVKVSGNYFDEELRDLGYVKSSPAFVGAFDYYHSTKRWDNKLLLEKSLKGKQNISITSAFSTYDKAKVKYLNDLVLLEKIPILDPSASDTTRFRNRFSRGTYSNENLEKISFQSGYEYTYETAEGKRLDETKSIGEISGFLSANIHPLKKLNFQPGLRYIHNFTYEAPLTYSINVMWDVFDFMKLRGSYAKGFRAPSIKELYLDFQDINHHITGNPDLDAETGNNYNVWMDFDLNKQKEHSIKVSSNFYFNRINNKIELLFDPNDATAAVYFNVPAGAMISRGYSTDITYKMHPRLTLNTGIFHNAMSSIVNTDEFTRGTDFASSFRYKNVKYRFELSVFYKYTDRYNRYVGSIDMDTGEIMDVELQYLDAYHNMDATISVPLFKSAVRISGGVKNIFDNTTIASTGGGGVHSGGSGGNSLLNWGRTYFIKASYNLQEFLGKKE